jgi:prepilin-type N-terminal cleavage/methylation domain-containing protein
MTRIKIKNGFTLIELLIVIAIIGLLSSIILTSVVSAREKARRTAALETIRQLQKALEMYATDTGYYPPDVNRGWDPGLVKPLPYDATGSGQDCNTTPGSCTCGVYLPCTGPYPIGFSSDWLTSIPKNWRGPYISKWPTNTPWGGVYDYNYWSVPQSRGICGVINPYMTPQGMYFGIESGSGFTVDASVEQKLFNEGLDNDGCPTNGEAQLLLIPL